MSLPLSSEPIIGGLGNAATTTTSAADLLSEPVFRPPYMAGFTAGAVPPDASGGDPTSAEEPDRLVAPDLQWLIDFLRRKGVVSVGRDAYLQPLPANRERREGSLRRVFIVWDDRKPVGHVQVGLHLAKVYRAAMAFAAAAPAIACKPLFFLRHQRFEILGSEYFGGRRLDHAVRDGQIDAAGCAAAIEAINQQLAGTEMASTPTQALRELDHFARGVRALEWWSDFDRVYLREVVFPFLKENLITTAPRTRWTNGDFIASNLLVESDGAVRLIDYEFAQRTHFFHDDGHRFSSFSGLANDFVRAARFPQSKGTLAQQLYFLLNHARLCAAVLPAVLAENDIGNLARRMMEAFASAATKRRSLFVPGLVAPQRTSRPSPLDSRPASLRVHWTSNDTWRPEDCTCVSAGTGSSVSVVFHLPTPGKFRRLRIFPSDRPGIVYLAGISVRCAVDDTVLLALPGGVAAATVGGTALALPSESGLVLLSTGEEPYVELPPFAAEETRPLRVEVWLCIENDFKMLHRLVEAAQKGKSPPPSSFLAAVAPQSLRAGDESSGRHVLEAWNGVGPRPDVGELQLVASASSTQLVASREQLAIEVKACTEAERKLAEMGEDVEVLTKEVDRLRGHRTALEEALAQHCAGAAAREAELSQALEKSETCYRTHTSQLEKAVGSADARAELGKATGERLQRELGEIRSVLAEKEAELGQLHQLRVADAASIQELQQRAASASARLAELDSGIETLRGERAAAFLRLQTLGREVAARDSAIATLHEQLVTAARDREAIVGSKNGEIERLSRLCAIASTESGELRQRGVELAERSRALEAELAQVRVEFVSAEQTADELRLAWEALRVQLGEAERRAASVGGELEQRGVALQRAEVRIQELEAAAVRLEATWQAKATERETAIQAFFARTAAEQEGVILGLRQRTECLEGQLHASDTDWTAARKEHEALQEEHRTLRGKSKRWLEALHALNDAQHTHAASAQWLTSENSRLKEAVERAGGVAASLRASLETQRQEMATSLARASEIETQLRTDLEGQRQAAAAQCARAEETEAQLRAALEIQRQDAAAQCARAEETKAQLRAALETQRQDAATLGGLLARERAKLLELEQSPCFELRRRLRALRGKPTFES